MFITVQNGPVTIRESKCSYIILIWLKYSRQNLFISLPDITNVLFPLKEGRSRRILFGITVRIVLG